MARRPCAQRLMRSCCPGFSRRLPAVRRHRPVRAGDARDHHGRGRGLPCSGSATAFRSCARHICYLAHLSATRACISCAGIRLCGSRTHRPPGPGFRNRPGDRGPGEEREGAYIADEQTLDRLEGEGRVVFRYVNGNPNGSRRDIAGITNVAGNVVGLMPHPEHAIGPLTGPGTDGLGLFTLAVGTGWGLTAFK